MVECKLLTAIDYKSLQNFFNKFEEIYSENPFPEYYLEKLVDDNKKFKIAAVIDNNNIQEIMIGSTIDYNAIQSNTMPIFLLVGHKSIVHSNSFNRDILVRTIASYFHEMKYYSFLVSFKFHHSFNYQNCHEKLAKFFRRGFESESYDYYLEDIISSNVSWEEVPTVYRYVIDKDCTEKETRVVIRGVLRYHLR